MSHRLILPEGWPRPKGYAHGIVAHGPMLFTGGVIGWDENGIFAGPDLVSQFEQVLKNTVAILTAGNATPADVVRMTWYITDRMTYVSHQAELGAMYRTYFGRHYPPMAVIGVKELIEPAALVEIETTAVISNNALERNE
jgi:enamine deaminase RidA (YjgF/YER057c/UK114 family)